MLSLTGIDAGEHTQAPRTRRQQQPRNCPPPDTMVQGTIVRFADRRHNRHRHNNIIVAVAKTAPHPARGSG